METSRDRNYMTIGYSFLDSGMTQKVGGDALFVYMALRRFSNRNEHGALGKFHKKHIIVCSRSIRDIADYCNLSSSSVHRAISLLVKEKWVRCELFSGFKHNQNIYILGEYLHRRGSDGAMRRVEMYLVDGLAEMLVGKVRVDETAGQD